MKRLSLNLDDVNIYFSCNNSLHKIVSFIDTKACSSYDYGTLVEIFLPDLTAQGGVNYLESWF